MRKFLAIWLSCLTMAGAAQAATIDGLNSVVAGSPTEFTFNYDPFGIDFKMVSYTSSVNLNEVAYLPDQNNLIDALNGGTLKLTKIFQPNETLLTLEVVLNVVAWGSWEIANMTGNCSGLAPNSCSLNWDDSPLIKRNSTLSFVFEQPVTFEGAALAKQSPSSAQALSVVPIAGTLPFLLSGLGLLGWFARRQRMAAV